MTKKLICAGLSADLKRLEEIEEIYKKLGIREEDYSPQDLKFDIKQPIKQFSFFCEDQGSVVSN